MNEIQKLFLLSILFDETGTPQLVDQEGFLEDFPHLFKPSTLEETQEARLIRTLATARAAGFSDKTDEEAVASLMAAPTSFPEEKARAVVGVVRGVSYYFDLSEDTPKVNAETVAALIAENILIPEVAALLSDEDNAAPDAATRQLTAIQMHLADQIEAPAEAPAEPPVTETPATETLVAEEETAPVTDTPIVEPVMETPTEEPAIAPEEDDVPVTAEEDSNLPAPVVELDLTRAQALGTATLKGVAQVAATNVAIHEALAERAQAILNLAGEITQLSEGGKQMNRAVVEAASEATPALPTTV